MSHPSGVWKFVEPRSVTAPAGVPKSSGTTKMRAICAGGVGRQRRRRPGELDVLAQLAHAAGRQGHRDGVDGLAVGAGLADVEGEAVLAVAEVLDEERLVFLQRRVDQVAKATAGLEDRAVPGVLRKERPPALLPGPHPHAGARGVGEQAHVHGDVQSTAWSWSPACRAAS